MVSTHKVLSLAIVVSLSFNVLADETSADSDAFSSHWYLGGKLGVMKYQNACEEWAVDCDGTDVALGGFIGYQVWQHWGLELGYLDFGEAKALYPEGSKVNQYAGSMSGIEMSVVGRIPVTDNLDAFAKAGTLYWQGKNSGPTRTLTDDGWAPTAGVGLEYHFSNHWAGRVEYQYVNALGSDKLGGSNGHLATLGIVYRFSSAEDSKPETQTEPKPVTPIITTRLPELHSSVLFAFDSEKIENVEVLNPIVYRLTRYLETRATVYGYTDSTGPNEYNQSLSERRANAVYEYLRHAGVSTEQLRVAGYGEDSPVVPNDTTEHRHMNRRVTVHIEEMTTPSSTNQN
ncbi:outer membrane beta-barrel protein [Vibrio mediterranei]|uniref:outer membrane beta-barrel protein n=1 Tax=Vibrio mediterranei TaxID=689 RepID=UPI0017FE8F5D|nr:outer membrane beta-barrel protein [Vibrio mediterranei]NUW73068.1 outer membrane beta-barrel protein [Vibrio mediterranei]